jgi:peptidyl-prolyl cis-trans isomerase B (cyclophilin B)
MDDEKIEAERRPDTAPIPLPPRPPAAAPQERLEYKPAQQYSPQQQYAPQPGTNGLAIASFVLAFFVSLLSIIFGHVALSQIKRTGERGRGLALAGLWISYLSMLCLVGVLVAVWVAALGAQNAAKSATTGYGGGAATYSPYYCSTPQPYYSAPAAGSMPTYGSAPTYGSVPSYSAPGSSSAGTGPDGAALPASSTPSSSPDKAYCQDRGVLVWLAKSATYRGALCSIDGSLTMISMASDVGGNVTLPAKSGSGSFSATANDGTVYTYTPGTVTITTAAKTFTEPTALWESGTASSLASPGDLGLATPISYPSCDDSAIVVYGTAWHEATDPAEVQRLLAAHPGSSYMRTDLSCRDFLGPSTANSGGAYVYAVYSPTSSQVAACQQTAGTPFYGRVLSNSREPGDNKVTCG